MVTRSTVRSRRGFIFPPFRTDITWKITITHPTTNSEIDITSFISSAKIADFCTDEIGNFEISLEDPNEEFVNLWIGNEIFRYYKDYGDSANTLRFRGRIEKISKQYHKLLIVGRSESLKFLNILVTYSGTNYTHNILNDLINAYADGFTNNNVQSSTRNITVGWYEKPFWDCVKDLCAASGFECFIDANLDFNYFQSGTRKNYVDCVAHDHNLLSIDEFAPDISSVRNRIIIYGGLIDNVQIIYTTEDINSQSKYGLKEERINDDNIISYSQAIVVGDFELNLKKNPALRGSVSCFLLNSIKPGDSIYISDSSDKLIPDFYNSSGYVDELDYIQGVFKTEIFLSKKPRAISDVLSDRIVNENKKSNNSLNPHGLKQALIFTFDIDEGTHSSTSIANGVLFSSVGNGIWISPSRNLSVNLSEVYLILNAEDINNVFVSFSSDGGINYTNINNGDYFNISGGSELIIKINLTSVSAQVKSLSLLYT